MSVVQVEHESQVRVEGREVAIKAVCYHDEMGQSFVRVYTSDGDGALEVQGNMVRWKGPGYDLTLTADPYSITRIKELIRQFCVEIEKEKQKQAG